MEKGDIFNVSFKVDENTYLGFIDLFKDKNPLHISDDIAISKGFQSKVMHGNILNGFISYFVGEYLPEKNVMIYSQVINYKKPVYLFDELLLTVKIIDFHISVQLYDMQYEFTNNRNEKVAIGKLQIGLK